MKELNEFSKFKTYFGDNIPVNTLKMAYVNFSINGAESYNVVDDLQGQGIEADATLALAYSKLATATKDEIAKIKDDKFIKSLGDPVELRKMILAQTKNMSTGLEMGVK